MQDFLSASNNRRHQPGYQSADFYLDTEAPQISYLLMGFGSYLFHTFAQEYRFRLKPLAGAGTPPPAAASSPATAPSVSPPALPARATPGRTGCPVAGAGEVTATARPS